MKLGCWLRLIWCVGAYCGCGGAPFSTLEGPAPASAVALPADAGALVDASGGDDPHPVSTTDAASGGDMFKGRRDGGGLGDTGTHVPTYDAGDVVEASSPASSADAAEEAPPPPPPALCCLTPCGGTTPAPIACGNGAAWTCAAGSCADRACSVGATCEWMGAMCVGRVGACP